MPEVEKYPIKWKLQALAYSSIMEKVRPFLEESAVFKARTKAKEKEVMDRAMGRKS